MRNNRMKYAIKVVVAGCFMMAAVLLGMGTVQGQTPVPAVAWNLTDTTSTQTNDNPQYTVNIRQPKAPTDEAFNAAVQAIIDKAVDGFKQSAAEGVPLEGATSGLDVTYDVFVTRQSLASVRFSLDSYISGAAHPAHSSVTLNYDFNTSKVLQLSDLFKADSNYLAFLSTYSTEQLKREDRLMFPEGALPKPENFQNWSLDRSGLLITFDPYTVGPGAQGESVVFVPYYALGDMLQTEYWRLW